MKHVRVCRQYALQCFRWATTHDTPHQQAFVEAARSWLKTADLIESGAQTDAQDEIRARLH